MTNSDIETHKRKRKHKSKKSDGTVSAKAPSNGEERVQEPRKRAKKAHTPELETENGVANTSADDIDVEDIEDEGRLSKEAEQIDMEVEVANNHKNNDSEQEEGSEADGEAMGAVDLPSGISMPMMDSPKLFSELKLSDRTMEAIQTMGFDTMTEIQQKAIPPLLRYGYRLLWEWVVLT